MLLNPLMHSYIDTSITPPTQELWLFLFNAAYAAAFFTYSVATNVYSRTHGLIRDYGLNEADADPQFYMLKRWARVNQHAVFWLQQVCTILCGRQTLSD